VEVVVSLSQGRTAAAQCGFFTYKSVPVIFEPPCTFVTFESRDRFHELSWRDVLMFWFEGGSLC